MKKIIISIIALVFIIPSVTYASWWNPTSWFNNWSFSAKSNNKTLILEKKMEELTSELNTPTTTPLKKTLPSLKGLGVTTTSLLTKQDTPSQTSLSIIEDQRNMILTGIDGFIIRNDSNKIRELETEISFLNQSIDLAIKQRDNVAEAKSYDDGSSVLGDKYVKTANLFIEACNDDILYYNKVITYDKKVIDILAKNITQAQNNKKLIESKIYKNADDVKKDLDIFVTQWKQEMALSEQVNTVYNNSIEYEKNRKNMYLTMLDMMKTSLNKDQKSLSEISIPSHSQTVIPVIPQIQIPKTIYCTMSRSVGNSYDVICN